MNDRTKKLQESLVYPRSSIIGWQNGEPIPAPIEICENVLTHSTMQHLAVHLGMFPSISQAMKNGWKGDIPFDTEIKRKKKAPIIVRKITHFGINMRFDDMIDSVSIGLSPNGETKREVYFREG